MSKNRFYFYVTLSFAVHALLAVFAFYQWGESLNRWSGGRFDRGGVITVNLTVGDGGVESETQTPPTETPPQSTAKDALQVPQPKPPKPASKGSESAAPKVSSGEGASPTPAGGRGEGYDASLAANPASEVLAKIRQRILRAKQYPSLARRQGIEGAVEVKFQIAPDGSLKSAAVTRSSGSPLLDEGALATLKKGQPYPFYEKEIRMSLRFDLAQ